MLGPGLTRTTLLTGIVGAVFVLVAALGFVAVGGGEAPPWRSVDDGSAEATDDDRLEESEERPQKPEKKQNLDLADRIPPGERAVRLGLDKTAAVAGNLEAGDAVDIWGAFDQRDPAVDEIVAPGDAEQQPLVTNLLQNVAVLEVDKPGAGEDERPAGFGVVVSLTPDEADLLRIVETDAELTLALRDEGYMQMHPVQNQFLSQRLDEVDTHHDVRANQLSVLAANPRDDRTHEEIAIEEAGRFQTTPSFRTVAIEARVPSGPTVGVGAGDNIDLVGLFSADEVAGLDNVEGLEVEDGWVSVDLTQFVEVVGVESNGDSQRVVVRATLEEIETLIAAGRAGDLVGLVRGQRDFASNDPDHWTTRELLEGLDFRADRASQRLEQIVERPDGDGGEVRRCDPETTSARDGEIVEGERAMAVDLEALDATSLIPEPGDRVDFSAKFAVEDVPDGDHDSEEGEPIVYNAFQGMKVLEVGEESLSVSATRREAHLLAHAVRIGELDVQVRSPEDDGAVPIEGQTKKGLLYIPPREGPCGCADWGDDDRPDPPEPDEIEIIR